MGKVGWVYPQAEDNAVAHTPQRVEAARERSKEIKELQREFYDRGGYIIWGFPNQVDAYHNYVVGARPHPSGVALSQALFYDMWIAEA